jgi:hypothetical protein
MTMMTSSDRSNWLGTWLRRMAMVYAVIAAGAFLLAGGRPLAAPVVGLAILIAGFAADRAVRTMTRGWRESRLRRDK